MHTTDGSPSAANTLDHSDRVLQARLSLRKVQFGHRGQEAEGQKFSDTQTLKAPCQTRAFFPTNPGPGSKRLIESSRSCVQSTKREADCNLGLV